MNFGNAFECMQHGQKAKRNGWNGKNQTVQIQNPSNSSKMTVPYCYIENEQGDRVPWVPSQGDLFATDWIVTT